MTFRADISIDWYENPRIANVTSVSAEIATQDSHDTLATLQDEWEGGQFPDLVSTAGKEDLGGGTTVGLTQTLQNVQYAPLPTTPRETGTMTGNDPLGVTLTDTGKDFVAANIVRGDWIINFTDQSVTEVLGVTTTTLRTRGLRDGITNTFTAGDSYKVWEVSEFVLTGGNYVAVDDNDVNLNPLFPVFGRFITKTAASSATLQSQTSLNAAAYGGGVAIDALNTTAIAVNNDVFPTGTRQIPALLMENVKAISLEQGLRDIFVMSDLVVQDADISDYPHTFIGDSPFILCDIQPSGLIGDAGFSTLTLSGDLGPGNNLVRDCVLTTVTGLSGVAEKCAFADEVTLNGDLAIFESYSQRAGAAYPVFVTSFYVLEVSDWHRSIGITGMTGGVHTIEMYGGQIHLDATCTGGTIYLRGDCSLPPDDLSNGTQLIDQTRSTKGDEMYARLDLDRNNPSTYTNDGSNIVNRKFGSLTKTDTGIVSIVQRS